MHVVRNKNCAKNFFFLLFIALCGMDGETGGLDFF